MLLSRAKFWFLKVNSLAFEAEIGQKFSMKVKNVSKNLVWGETSWSNKSTNKTICLNDSNDCSQWQRERGRPRKSAEKGQNKRHIKTESARLDRLQISITLTYQLSEQINPPIRGRQQYNLKNLFGPQQWPAAQKWMKQINNNLQLPVHIDHHFRD